MRLQRKITYGEFPEFVREKKFTYTVHILKKLILKSEFIFVIQVTYGNWKRHLDPPGAMAATDKNTKINNKEIIKIDWSVSDWSKCSHTCGKNGTQIRKVECVAIKGDKEQTIPKQICSDAGFKVSHCWFE